MLTRLPVSRKQQSRERSLVVHLKLVLFTPQPYPHTYERCVELRARLICVAVRALGSYLVNSKAHCFTQQQSIEYKVIPTHPRRFFACPFDTLRLAELGWFSEMDTHVDTQLHTSAGMHCEVMTIVAMPARGIRFKKCR